ncbi:MAG: helix-turn-helix transcriptional regulator [Chloroflexi bacterium]|nr:helix-turn-helix transcriptional regulator [Chloroflexota bacterium]
MTPHCPTFQAALELVGRRWTGAIIRSMLYGSARFSDIMSQIPGLSDRLLSERLRELESAGLVLRTVYPLTPVRIEYALTEKGRELREVLIAIDHWASRWAGTPSACASAEAGFAAEAAHACVQPDA